MQWMIYGAYGYTGELIARQAIAQGERPVLAGRNETRLKALAEELALPYRVVSLSDTEELHQALTDVDLVVHSAGPFEVTAPPMLEACLATKTHYLDITGELDVFEQAFKLDQRARDAGVVLCPGVGFDVIPTDCVASRLKAALPDASHLELGFDSRSRMSRGTAKTSVRRLGEGGAVRQQGQIRNVPLAYKAKEIDFGGGRKMAMTIPWGDVSTAFHSTGIPNIEVYIPASPKLVKRMRKMNWLRWILRTETAKNYLSKKVDEQPAGPKDEEREKYDTWVWGQATNDQGQQETLRVRVENGYTLTSKGAVVMARHVLQTLPAGGFYTPSQLYGADLIEQFRTDQTATHS